MDCPVDFESVLFFTGLNIPSSELICYIPSPHSERIACGRVLGHFKMDFSEAKLMEHVSECDSCRNKYVDYLKKLPRKEGEDFFDLDERYLNIGLKDK